MYEKPESESSPILAEVMKELENDPNSAIKIYPNGEVWIIEDKGGKE